MTITINDEMRSLTDPSTLFDLLQSMELAEQNGIAVAINEQVVTKVDWPDYTLQETDRVTIIQATQGG
ncbi:MAG: thiamine biosynthesis protein ThiS [Opitutaceae bacterium]|nr:thiamine biosynthesis protein ThiS [Opitutaceae bacterium]|tara:strand:+ start:2398 stop:2601 length:204 start_codon:yes stop_codon:yes gene_type:complete